MIIGVFSIADWTANLDIHSANGGISLKINENSDFMTWSNKIHASAATSPAEVEFNVCVASFEDLLKNI